MKHKKLKIEIGKFYLNNHEQVYVFAHETLTTKVKVAVAIKVEDMMHKKSLIFVTHNIDEEGYEKSRNLNGWSEVIPALDFQVGFKRSFSDASFHWLNLFLPEVPKIIESLNEKESDLRGFTRTEFDPNKKEN